MAEAASLALAVLPLLINAGSHYREVVDLLQTIRPKTGDECILAFHEDVAFELYRLRSTIGKLIENLPGFSEEYKNDLLGPVQPERWRDETLSSALRRKLGDVDYTIFEMTLRSLFMSLNELASRNSRNQQLLSSSEILDEDRSYLKLSIFRKDVIAGNTLSTLRSRVRFATSQHKLLKYLSNIKKYNDRLRQLVEGSSDVKLDLQMKSPSPKIPMMARTIHDALSRSWNCSCEAPHKDKLFDARLCLNNDMSFKDSFEFSFDILFVTQGEKDGTHMEHHSWQESIIHMEPKRKVTLETLNKEVKSICEVIQAARGHEICLQMLLDDQKLWQIRPQSKRLNLKRNITLDAILHGSTQLSVRDKRVLSVTLAKVVLQLSDGPWLRKRWTPAQISFFETAQNTINFERPYLSAQFKEETTDDADAVLDAQSAHASPSLLSLGKLLLEIDLGRRIETCPVSLTDGKLPSADPELDAAMRIFSEASKDLYENCKTAIQACFDPDIRSGGLEDEKARQLVYERVIVPLEDELYRGFKVRISGNSLN